jgi:MoaA/NifB/PqqE/SkfB family radical SAM enzyme
MTTLKPSADDIKKYNLLRAESHYPTACNAASNSMYFYPDGYITPCCHSKDFIYGKYPETSLKDIWFGFQRKSLETALCNYNFELGCETCYRNIASGNYSATEALRFDNFKNKTYPTNIEFQLHNHCNLECIMCSGVLSSSIRENRDKLPPLPMLYNEKFLEELNDFIPHLTHATFSGGESFMIKIYYEIWQKIVEKNPTCAVTIITNGSVLNNKIKELLNKGKFNIVISIDAFDKKIYETIRKNAHYETLLKNLEYIAEIRATTATKLNINFCPMPENMYHIPAFVTKCNELKCGYYFSIVYLPSRHSLESLPQSELEKLELYLKANEPNNYYDNENKARYHAFIKNVATWKKQADNTEITTDYFIHQFTIMSNQAIAKHQEYEKLSNAISRINFLVKKLDKQINVKSLSKALLEKDNIIRSLEETAIRTEEQSENGLLYHFGNKKS